MRRSNLYLSCFSRTDARVAQVFLDQEHMQTLPWPAFCPDMSPIAVAWMMCSSEAVSAAPHTCAVQEG